jgi:hypothetical protein
MVILKTIYVSGKTDGKIVIIGKILVFPQLMWSFDRKLAVRMLKAFVGYSNIIRRFS